MRSLRLFLPSSLPVAANERGALAALPGLARILSRGRAASLGDKDLEALLLESFGVQRQRDWPVAPFSWLGEGGDAHTRYWLRADPVHLRAERDALMLVDARHLTLEPESAGALIAALNAHFASEGLRFFAPNPTRWYVTTPRTPDLATCPLHAAAGRSIDPLLPKGTDALTWHRWFNEIQMLFHSHPVNEAREAADQPTINSVWFWGGGMLPASVAGRFAGIWGDDPLVRGLARASGLICAAPPEDAAEWLARAGEGEHLLVLDALSMDQGSSLLTSLERRWFAPMLHALRGRQLTAVTLVLGGGDGLLRFELAAGDLWKFWRRVPALVH